MMKEYLGDGLYVEFNGYGLTLTTERDNGVHYIYLEPRVWDELINFMKRTNKKTEE